MSGPNKTYRICCFDGGNMILSSELIEAADDGQAIAMVKAARYGCKCEVWQGRRLVAQLDGDRPQA